METKDDKIIFAAFLPWPPSVNSYWARTRAGMKRTKKAKEYIEKIAELAVEQSLPTDLDGKLSMYLRLVPPDKRRRDADNYFKSLFDSLVYCGVIVDDKDIHEIHAIKDDPKSPGSVLMICKYFDD